MDRSSVSPLSSIDSALILSLAYTLFLGFETEENPCARSQRRTKEAKARFEQRTLKRKQKHRGH